MIFLNTTIDACLLEVQGFVCDVARPELGVVRAGSALNAVLGLKELRPTGSEMS